MKELLKKILGEVDFKKIINHELTWALFLIGSLLVFVSHAYIEDRDKQNESCEREITALKIDLAKEREARFKMYDKLLHLQDTVQVNKETIDKLKVTTEKKHLKKR